jgi:hypothetical protein
MGDNLRELKYFCMNQLFTKAIKKIEVSLIIYKIKQIISFSHTNAPPLRMLSLCCHNQHPESRVL